MKFAPILCASVLCAALPSFAADAAADASLLKKAEQIQTRILAFDSHLDLPFDYAGAAEDGKTQFDLPKVFRGHLKGAALAVFVPQGPRTPEGYAKARNQTEGAEEPEVRSQKPEAPADRSWPPDCLFPSGPQSDHFPPNQFYRWGRIPS
jgi:Membrane dipeptidase (Peptidase family M19)